MFTAARMRPGFGEGVSIPSQRRWLRYVEAWVRDHGKKYIERRARVHEIHITGLRPGVRVAIRGFEDEGRRIVRKHVFLKAERRIVAEKEDDGVDVVLVPEKELWLDGSDVDIEFEKRNGAAGYNVVTSVSHVWFNAFFEGRGDESGVFEIKWDAMDGVKGTTAKGMQALEALRVVWSVEGTFTEMQEPEVGIPVPETGYPLEGASSKDLGEETEVVTDSEGEDIITDASDDDKKSTVVLAKVKAGIEVVDNKTALKKLDGGLA